MTGALNPPVSRAVLIFPQPFVSALNHIATLLSHGPRHPLVHPPRAQTVLEAVDQTLRPADEDVGVRPEQRVRSLHNVAEAGPRAGRGENNFRGGAVRHGAAATELDVGESAKSAAMKTTDGAAKASIPGQ